MSNSASHLLGKVVIVSGAGSGIGEAAAIAFAHAGAKVVLVGRSLDPLRSTEQRIAEAGGHTLVVTADMSVERDVERLVSTTLDKFGRLDCAFNNAGIQGPQKPIVEMTEKDFDAVIATNLKGVWLAMKHELRVMTKAGAGGAIVNTSSFLSTAASTGSSAYSASKAGVDALIRSVALEVGPLGIRVNNINPGVIDTPMLRAHGDEIRGPLGERAALKRLGTPEDIANAAVWLCTDGASFITGQSILVDGGFTIPGPR